MARPIPPREWEEEILRMRARIVTLEGQLRLMLRTVETRLYLSPKDDVNTAKLIRDAQAALDAHNPEDELKPGGGL